MRTLYIVRGLLTGLLLSAQTDASASPAPPDSGATSKTKDWRTWGPYRPGLYFGVRPNIPETLLMGLMWGNGTNMDSLRNTLRDTCEQNDDGIENFGWDVYDPRVGGSQTIRDKALGIDLTTEFVKNDDGSGWAVRASGAVRPDAPVDVVTTALIFHVAMEGSIGSNEKGLSCERLDTGGGHINGVVCRGRDPALGPFDLRVNADPQDQAIKGSVLWSQTVSNDQIWQAKSTYLRSAKTLAKDSPGPGNMHFVGFSFEGPFSATLSYRDEGGLHISPDAILAKLEDQGPSISKRVQTVFPRTPPFRSNRHAAFSQALLSNLLGGLGFFHGDSKIASNVDDLDMATSAGFGNMHAMADTKFKMSDSSSLISFTPSRSFFPRGFLWDEGFHLLPILEWDIDLAITVLRSWISQMSDDGWIAREQILGPEARSRVPKEFQVQYPHHANPPTLIALVLPALVAKLTSRSPYNGYKSTYITSQTERAALLRELYPALSKYYQHFRRTQAGNFSSTYPRPPTAIAGEGYFWRGRTAQHTLASGLDDYPRPDPPSQGELHVDALAWVAASAKALLEVAEYLALDKDADVYRAQLTAAQHNLDALHWSERQHGYCDATVDGASAYAHVCHVGYVSLMPLLLGLMDSSHPRLPALLATVANPEKLWSQHGLRSLSAQDSLYGQGENYWRGAVWMNINTLAVLRLREIGLEGLSTPSRQALRLAEGLRKRVVSTVYDSWMSSGFVWEQYGDAGGDGRRSKGFTGWTATVLLLLGLEFVSPKAGVDDTITGMPRVSLGDPRHTVSTKTVMFWVMVILVVMLLRRRLLRMISRITGAWRARRQRASLVGGTKLGLRNDEVIALEDRKD